HGTASYLRDRDHCHRANVPRHLPERPWNHGDRTMREQPGCDAALIPTSPEAISGSVKGLSPQAAATPPQKSSRRSSRKKRPIWRNRWFLAGLGLLALIIGIGIFRSRAHAHRLPAGVETLAVHPERVQRTIKVRG